MNLKELFWSGGGMVLVLLSLIEVSPIKINPWSRLAKIIGHALNAEVLEQQKQTQKKLEEHIQVDDERNANLLRTQILRFNDELIDDKHHTREHFIEILAIIDAYEDYCRSHPDYKNNRCICAVANIKRCTTSGFKSTTSLEGGFLHESHRISGQRHISPEQKFHP